MHCISLTYTDLTTYYVPGPRSISYLGIFILPIVALSTPVYALGHKQLCTVFIPLIIACVVHAWIAMGGPDVISVDHGFRAVVLLAQADPRAVFRRCEIQPDSLTSKDDAKAPGHIEVPYPETAPLSTRCRWVLGLMASDIRFDNWKVGIPAHDRRQPFHPRIPARGPANRAYILYALIRGVLGYLILDLSMALLATDTYFSDPTVSLIAPIPFPFNADLYRTPHLRRATRTLLSATFIFTMLSQQVHLPLSLLCALVEAHILPPSLSPHNIPPPFRSARHTFRHGLRGFWSRTWHQSVRYSAGGMANLTNRVLGVDARRRPALADVLGTTVAFAVSGIMHMGLVAPVPLYAAMSVGRVRLVIFAFFVVQAPALMLEDAVKLVLRRWFGQGQKGWGMESLKYLLNTLWIVGWVWLCFPLIMDGSRNIGLYRVRMMPWSAVEYYKTGQGWMWPCMQ